MKLNYLLTNSDFLAYQLFASSKSKLIKKKRFRARFAVFVIYILIGFYFAVRYENKMAGIGFASFGVLWFVFFPKISQWIYKRHYKKHVEENYKNRINKPVEIVFDKDSIKAKDVTSETKIKASELKELIETKAHFFVKLSTDLSLIVPKSAVDNLIEFKKNVTDLGAKYVDELNWEWK